MAKIVLGYIRYHSILILQALILDFCAFGA
jgi:hypothetical protein